MLAQSPETPDQPPRLVGDPRGSSRRTHARTAGAGPRPQRLPARWGVGGTSGRGASSTSSGTDCGAGRAPKRAGTPALTVRWGQQHEVPGAKVLPVKHWTPGTSRTRVVSASFRGAGLAAVARSRGRPRHRVTGETGPLEVVGSGRGWIDAHSLPRSGEAMRTRMCFGAEPRRGLGNPRICRGIRQWPGSRPEGGFPAATKDTENASWPAR
jgi:hypothetical protein